MKSIVYVCLITIMLTPTSPGAKQADTVKQTLSPVETAEQAVQLALIYTGFDDSDELTMLRPDEMAVQTVMRGSSIPFLVDSVLGRHVWKVNITGIVFEQGRLASVGTTGGIDIEVTIDRQTGRLIGVTSTHQGVTSVPSLAQFDVEDDSTWLLFNEVYHGFPDYEPKVSLWQALRKVPSCSLSAQVMTARYVLESHVTRGTSPVTPVWSITCWYTDEEEQGADKNGSTRRLSVGRAIIDALTGDVLLEYRWHSPEEQK